MEKPAESEARARLFLPSLSEVESVLGAGASFRPATEHASLQSLGSVAAAAARDAAYRSMTGTIPLNEEPRPLAVGELVLVFDSVAKCEATFNQVAEASHLRIRLDETNVAVETVTSPNGLVSYWGYVQLLDVLLILTLDTVDPQDVSMTTFRSLVTLGAQKLQRAP